MGLHHKTEDWTFLEFTFDDRGGDYANGTDEVSNEDFGNYYIASASDDGARNFTRRLGHSETCDQRRTSSSIFPKAKAKMTMKAPPTTFGTTTFLDYTAFFDYATFDIFLAIVEYFAYDISTNSDCINITAGCRY